MQSIIWISCSPSIKKYKKTRNCVRLRTSGKGRCLRMKGDGLFSQLLKTVAVLRLSAVFAGSPFRRGFSSSRCICVDLSEKLQGYQSLHVGEIVLGDRRLRDVV